MENRGRVSPRRAAERTLVDASYRVIWSNTGAGNAKEGIGMSRFTVAAACFLALLPLAVSGVTAQEQEQEQEGFAYCRADVQRLCQGLRPGGGRLMECLKAHENDLTVGCAKELQSMKARMGK